MPFRKTLRDIIHILSGKERVELDIFIRNIRSDISMYIYTHLRWRRNLNNPIRFD